MKSGIALKHEFVEFIPDELQRETLYISIRFATASHLCCCGCGSKVVTPIRPTDWKLIFDGKTVSLYPSVGNWSFPCQSHYWIRNSRVEWASRWSHEKIEKGRLNDVFAKEEYFEAVDAGARGGFEQGANKPKESRERGFWQSVRKLFS
jgi:hypothetical protein